MNCVVHYHQPTKQTHWISSLKHVVCRNGKFSDIKQTDPKYPLFIVPVDEALVALQDKKFFLTEVFFFFFYIVGFIRQKIASDYKLNRIVYFCQEVPNLIHLAFKI